MSDHAFSVDDSHEHNLDFTHERREFGEHRHNGHLHANIPHKTPDDFFDAVATSLGEPSPEEAGHDRIAIALEVFGGIARFVMPRRNGMTPRETLEAIGSRFATLLSRTRPDLLPAHLRSETQIAVASRLTRAAISRRITNSSDELGFHLGLRSPASREKFRKLQREMYADGRRTPRGKGKSPRKSKLTR